MDELEAIYTSSKKEQDYQVNNTLFIQLNLTKQHPIFINAPVCIDRLNRFVFFFFFNNVTHFFFVI
jgi:hypothetical protein